MTDDELKKIIKRFLKEHNIYSFITGEINKEYNRDFDKFIEKLKYVGIREFYNRRDILSFAWEGNTLDFIEMDKNVRFWRNIHNEWKKYYNSFRTLDT